jgi:hypothetical protein
MFAYGTLRLFIVAERKIPPLSSISAEPAQNHPLSGYWYYWAGKHQVLSQALCT